MLSSRFQHILSALAVIAWGALPLYLHSQGRLLSYLTPEFCRYALIGGLGMLVLGGFILLTAGTTLTQSCCHHHHHDHHHDHSHDDKDAHSSHDHDHQPALLSFVILLLPLLLSFKYTQDTLTETEIHNARTGIHTKQSAQQLFSKLPPFTLETLKKSTPQTPDGFFLIDLIQLYYASGDPEIQSVFTNLPVQTKGQILPEYQRNPDGNRLKLFQIVMTCCAADSAVIPVTLEFEGTPPSFSNRDWVQVQGTMHYERGEDIIYPIIKVSQVIPTQKPYQDQFLQGY